MATTKDNIEVVVNDGTANPRIIEMGICGDSNIESGVLLDINSDGEIVRCPDLSTNEGARVPIGLALKDYSPGDVVNCVTGDGIIVNAQMDGIYNSNHVGVQLGMQYVGSGRGRFAYVYEPNENARTQGILLSKTTTVKKTHIDDGSVSSGVRYYARVLMI